jgi:hypothetical protein
LADPLCAFLEKGVLVDEGMIAVDCGNFGVELIFLN